MSQDNWRWCRKCYALGYAGADRRQGVCHGGGAHDYQGSGNYTLPFNHGAIANCQNGWKYCLNCFNLVYNNKANAPCHGPGGHHKLDTVGNADYQLGFRIAPNHVIHPGFHPAQTGWWWCNQCGVISYDKNKGHCPATGGAHASDVAEYGIPMVNDLPHRW